MGFSRARIKIPASTSNFGPGFDCLGMALSLHNTVEVTRVKNAPTHHGMVGETAASFFQRVPGGKVNAFDFEVKIEGAIPISRGLGSSVTVRLGLLMGLAELVRETTPFSRNEILRLLIELEGHPDNAIPSFLGGFAVCARASETPTDGFAYTRVPVGSELSFVALIPDLRLSTEEARAILPDEISLRQAVENAQRTARIASIFCTGNYDALRGLFVDHFHQPYRQDLIPGFAEILGAAVEAGALGSFLSGAGSTLLAPTLGHAEEISQAMLAAAARANLPARALILQADNEGAQVLEAD